MARYLLRLAYDGGPFRGFAINEGVPTIGGALRFALEQVLQHEVPIVCAGRTDAGVHAIDQAVSFTTSQPVKPEALRTSLNSMCRPHIVVSSVTLVADEFDARFSCTGRAYRYRILNQRLPDPFRKDFTWRVSHQLDVPAMRAAGAHLIGTHDFTTFCRRQMIDIGDDKIEKSRTRLLRSIEWSEHEANEVHLLISAKSFCQQMVRSIVGLSVDVGLGLVTPDDVPEIVEARDRRVIRRVAPPQGLFLLEVTY